MKHDNPVSIGSRTSIPPGGREVSPHPAAAGGPLEGLRVIELATVIMGPYAGQQFGDLGADVIKVEAPGGDPTRQFEPKRHAGMGGPTLNLNRNKRSVTLDLKNASDRDSLLALLETADVFITNVRPGALERLSLGWEDVAAVNPRLVYATAQGFRSDSAMRDNAAYDDIIQAATGLVWLNEQVSGQPNYIPSVVADKVCGLMMVQSVLAALHYRDRTGRGQHVEIPMADTMIAFNLVEHLAGATLDPADESDYGYRRVLSRERKACRTADGWMCILPYNDANWRDFFEFAGDPAAATDPRFTTMAGRVANSDVLYARMRTLTAQFSTAQWQRLCDDASIPAHPVYSLAQSATSRYAQDGGLLTTTDHPTEGPYQLIGHPVRYSETPAQLRRHCPAQGQHTESILEDLDHRQRSRA
ncbi:CoA transferase [Rhodococcus opacus]|uniref:CaiB/BaiF CoA transferase family protein n=1 Tax=Rhodococcus opacus TaxID=37919 RepID=UPI002949A98E|nr:CoA transferase [Rhodococcus opacus]MDV6245305.1 CoA transferase [Rhodococcus opacus]WKN60484.1 CoA transferase [Rhodococcus opacus]